jgi:phosphoglycolate phosphatase
MLLEGLTRLAVSPADAVYVGDMAVDVQTARAAGVPAWLVLGGAGGEDTTTDADRVFPDFDELLVHLPEVSR